MPHKWGGGRGGGEGRAKLKKRGKNQRSMKMVVDGLSGEKKKLCWKTPGGGTRGTGKGEKDPRGGREIGQLTKPTAARFVVQMLGKKKQTKPRGGEKTESHKGKTNCPKGRDCKRGKRQQGSKNTEPTWGGKRNRPI